MAGILALMYADDLVVCAIRTTDLQEKGICHVLTMLGNTNIKRMSLCLVS